MRIERAVGDLPHQSGERFFGGVLPDLLQEDALGDRQHLVPCVLQPLFEEPAGAIEILTVLVDGID